jgi:hypothetical protein
MRNDRHRLNKANRYISATFQCKCAIRCRQRRWDIIYFWFFSYWAVFAGLHWYYYLSISIYSKAMIPAPTVCKFYTDRFIYFQFLKLHVVQCGRACEGLKTPLSISIMASIAEWYLKVPACSSRTKNLLSNGFRSFPQLLRPWIVSSNIRRLHSFQFTILPTHTI